jgi:hypothetical protein
LLNGQLQDWTLTDNQGQFSFANIPQNASFALVAQGYKRAAVPSIQQQILLEKKPTISNPVTLKGEVKNNGKEYRMWLSGRIMAMKRLERKSML